MYNLRDLLGKCGARNAASSLGFMEKYKNEKIVGALLSARYSVGTSSLFSQVEFDSC
jgi:hypothetical protein